MTITQPLTRSKSEPPFRSVDVEYALRRLVAKRHKADNQAVRSTSSLCNERLLIVYCVLRQPLFAAGAVSVTTASSSKGSEPALASVRVATLTAKHDWLDTLPAEVLRMVLSLVPDVELYSLLNANRRLHRMATSILLERKHFRSRGGRILILHENIAFTALDLYVR